MTQVINSAAFDPSVLQIEDVYMELLPPPLIIPAAPSHTGGLVGTASWGPKNTPVLLGSIPQLQQTFGPLGSAALTDQHDLVTDAYLALFQALGLGGAMSLVCVRVSDGTDVAATATITDTSTNPLITATSLYTGVAGNAAQIITSAGPTTGTTNVAVTMPGLPSESYVNIPNATFQTAFINAISQGQTGIRGPSQLISASIPLLAPLNITGAMFTPSITGGSLPSAGGAYRVKITLTNAQGETVASNEVSSITIASGSSGSIAVALGTLPYGATGFKAYITAAGGATGTELLSLTVASGNTGTIINPGATTSPPTVNTATIINTTAPQTGSTYTLSGASDGRSPNTAQIVGTDFNPATSAAPTGAYALRGQKVSTFACCGLTDTTGWAGLLPLCASEGMSVFFQFPNNTSTTTNITTKNSIGLQNYQAHAIQDFAYWYDPINAVTRSIPCTGIFVGMRASLGVQQNIGNKPVYGIVGTTRSNPITGFNNTYLNAELSLLEQNGITLITNPIPAGSVFGIRVGRNTAANLSQSASEYTSMTNFLVASISAAMGPYVNALQSQSDTDPLRQAITTALNQFLQQLVDNGYLGGFNVTCDLTNNTPTTIAAHQLYAFVQAQYLSAAMFIVVQLQGGSTVSVTAVQPST